MYECMNYLCLYFCMYLCQYVYITGVVDEIDHKIILDFNPPSTIDRNSL